MKVLKYIKEIEFPNSEQNIHRIVIEVEDSQFNYWKTMTKDDPVIARICRVVEGSSGARVRHIQFLEQKDV